jgi:hypothetical protein
MTILSQLVSVVDGIVEVPVKGDADADGTGDFEVVELPNLSEVVVDVDGIRVCLWQEENPHYTDEAMTADEHAISMVTMLMAIAKMPMSEMPMVAMMLFISLPPALHSYSKLCLSSSSFRVASRRSDHILEPRRHPTNHLYP